MDFIRKYKPAPETYQMVANELDVVKSDLRMVAAHAWDIIGSIRRFADEMDRPKCETTLGLIRDS